MRKTQLARKMTERRMEVLRLAACGLDNQEIARCIGRQSSTAGKHISDILLILGLTNRAQLVIYALKRGIIDLNEIPLEPSKTDNNF